MHCNYPMPRRTGAEARHCRGDQGQEEGSVSCLWISAQIVSPRPACQPVGSVGVGVSVNPTNSRAIPRDRFVGAIRRRSRLCNCPGVDQGWRKGNVQFPGKPVRPLGLEISEFPDGPAPELPDSAMPLKASLPRRRQRRDVRIRAR